MLHGLRCTHHGELLQQLVLDRVVDRELEEDVLLEDMLDALDHVLRLVLRHLDRLAAREELAETVELRQL